MTDLFLCGENLQSTYSHIDLQMGKASNYIVGLQQLWAIQHNPKLIVVQTVPTSRYEWIINSDPRSWAYNDLTAIPYSMFNVKCNNVFITGDSNYSPVIEFGDIDDILESKEPNYKKKLMIEYLKNVLDYEIKQHFDMGQIIRRYRQSPNNTLLVLNNDTMFLSSMVPRHSWTTDTDIDSHIMEFSLL